MNFLLKWSLFKGYRTLQCPSLPSLIPSRHSDVGPSESWNSARFNGEPNGWTTKFVLFDFRWGMVPEMIGKTPFLNHLESDHSRIILYICIYWVWPPPSNRGFLLTFTFHCYREGGHIQCIKCSPPPPRSTFCTIKKKKQKTKKNKKTKKTKTLRKLWLRHFPQGFVFFFLILFFGLRLLRTYF